MNNETNDNLKEPIECANKDTVLKQKDVTFRRNFSVSGMPLPLTSNDKPKQVPHKDEFKSFEEEKSTTNPEWGRS